MIDLRMDERGLTSATTLRRAALALACLGALALSACNRTLPEEAPPPPPPPMEEEAPPPPVLAGGPAEQAPRPMHHRRPGWGTMAPIPNPGDEPAEDQMAPAPGQRGPWMHGRHRHRPLMQEGMFDHRHIVAMAPIPNPEEGMVARQPGPAATPLHHRHRHDHHHRGRHGRHAGWSARHAAATQQKAPAAHAHPHAARHAPDSLKAALADDLANSVRLDVPSATLLAGKEARVSLSLPDSLLASIQAQAARLGLGKAASRANVSAELSGLGYSITPSGRQVARLEAGKPTTFSWLVRPTGPVLGPIEAKADAILRGGGKRVTTPLLDLRSAVTPAAGTEPQGSGGLDMSILDIPGHEQLDLPLIGKVASHTVVALLFIALFLIFILALTSDGSRRRMREEQRRWNKAAAARKAAPPPKDFPGDEPPPAQDNQHKPD